MSSRAAAVERQPAQLLRKDLGADDALVAELREHGCQRRERERAASRGQPPVPALEYRVVPGGWRTVVDVDEREAARRPSNGARPTARRRGRNASCRGARHSAPTRRCRRPPLPPRAWPRRCRRRTRAPPAHRPRPAVRCTARALRERPVSGASRTPRCTRVRPSPERAPPGTRRQPARSAGRPRGRPRRYTRADADGGAVRGVPSLRRRAGSRPP